MSPRSDRYHLGWCAHGIRCRWWWESEKMTIYHHLLTHRCPRRGDGVWYRRNSIWYPYFLDFSHMKYFLIVLAYILPLEIFAVPSTGINPPSDGWSGNSGNGWWIEWLLAYAEKFILQVVLPIGVVWVAIYVGYQLVTASGDEEKMKKAFKSLTYSSIGLIATACAYAFVYVLGRLSI